MVLIYVAVVVIFLGATYLLWVRRNQRRVLKRMAAGVDIVKAGIAVEFLLKYRLQHNNMAGAELAAAVINELFSDPPSTPEGAAFLSKNRDLVEEKMRELGKDSQIREALTQALRVKAMVAFAQGKRDREHLIKPIKKIKELGLLVPGGDMPSADTFFPLVKRCHRLIKPEE